MKIAIVHELLTKRGGAERMVKILADMFPKAPIYTLLYNEAKLCDWFPRHRVRVGPLQKTANILRHSPFSILHSPFNHHLYLRHFPKAVEAWDFSEFDLVISSSSAFAHGIITNGAPLHLSYIHSPARYLWDRTHDVLERANTGWLGPLRRSYLSRTFHKLRIWDSEAADRPDMLIAASKTVQRRIELYWRRKSEIIYPPIDDAWLRSPIRPSAHPTAGLRPAGNGKNYYLIVSKLVPYKKIDLAIHACNQLKRPLVIAGEGPARKYLQSIAGPTIEFLGYVPDADLPDLYAGAKALLFPGEEDFGLTPLEAMACGTPVIAFRGGGALETVIEGTTGEFFDAATAQSLQTVLQSFEGKTYDPDRCRAQAAEFSRERFEEQLKKRILALTESRYTPSR